MTAQQDLLRVRLSCQLQRADELHLDRTRLDLAPPVVRQSAPTLAHTQGGDGWQDGAGNLLATFSGLTVTNQSAIPRPAGDLRIAIGSVRAASRMSMTGGVSHIGMP